jgi:hypothetical protein
MVVELAAQPIPIPITDLRLVASVSLWLGVALLLQQVAQEWTLRRTLLRHAAGEQPTRVLVSEQGFEAETRGARSQIEWRKLRGSRESASHFLLYLGPEEYFILPKRAFGGKQEIAAFRDMLRRLVTRG